MICKPVILYTSQNIFDGLKLNVDLLVIACNMAIVVLVLTYDGHILFDSFTPTDAQDATYYMYTICNFNLISHLSTAVTWLSLLGGSSSDGMSVSSPFSSRVHLKHPRSTSPWLMVLIRSSRTSFRSCSWSAISCSVAATSLGNSVCWSCWHMLRRV